MQVERRWFADLKPAEIETIRRNQETVVVVDLWAATTNIVLMLGKNPARLIVINDEKYQAAEDLYQGAVLIGQSYQIPQEEFASGTNKTSDVDQVDVAGKIVLYLSFNGARVIEAFSTSTKGLVFIGALTNFQALASGLKKGGTDRVTIVASGNLTGEMGGVTFIEDFLGAEIIEKELKGERFDLEAACGRMKQEMLSYHPDDLEEADEKVWPYIFGPQVGILPTSFINDEGFVEVVDHGSGR